MEIQPRLDYGSLVPSLARTMGSVDHLVRSSSLAKGEPLLMELFKIRASQINGCAY
jgi:alkylhydroperoxidase family enzyme